MKKRVYQSLLWIVFSLVGAVLMIGVSAFLLVSESKPIYDGIVAVPSLTEEVEIAWDQYGVPVIAATDRKDAARALGFLHAQERLYAMDMQRRFAAGELAEVTGWAMLWRDERNRKLGLRNRALADYEALPPSDQRYLDAYAEGVNSVIRSLKARPWEYIILKTSIAEWRPEDSLLVGYAMYLNLQENLVWNEKCRDAMRRELPDDVYEFLAHNNSVWDSPILGESQPLVGIPGESSFSYLKAATNSLAQGDAKQSSLWRSQSDLVPGSNAWAISGDFTASGKAILANDMHLGLRIPNTWYRVALQYEEDGQLRQTVGATLPGLPIIVVGSNGSIAWGMTNSRVDVVDLVEVIPDPEDSQRYLTPNGSEAFESRTDIIKVKGGFEHRIEWKSTKWGPVEEESENRVFALRWKALEGIGINLDLRKLESASSVSEALGIAPKVEMPTLNAVFADDSGNVAWTLIGPIMDRTNYSGDLPMISSQCDPEWHQLDASLYPSVMNPEIGMVWNANGKSLLDDAGYLRYCHADTVTPARAWQIKKRLEELERPVAEEDLLAIQTDREAFYYHRWGELLLDVLEGMDDETLNELRSVVGSWDGMATADSAAFRIVRDYRERVAKGVMGRLLEPCFKKYHYFGYESFRYEDPLWMIVDERPDYLRSPEYADWPTELRSYASGLVAEYKENHGDHARLSERVWGEVNRLDMRHPLSRAIPLLGYWIDMPETPMGGDPYVLNSVFQDYGASQRMVVSPGSEENGIFHMPGGQSGHPMSEYYRKGHEEWSSGAPSPLVGRRTGMRLVLEPIPDDSRS